MHPQFEHVSRSIVKSSLGWASQFTWRRQINHSLGRRVIWATLSMRCIHSRTLSNSEPKNSRICDANKLTAWVDDSDNWNWGRLTLLGLSAPTDKDRFSRADASVPGWRSDAPLSATCSVDNIRINTCCICIVNAAQICCMVDVPSDPSDTVEPLLLPSLRPILPRSATLHRVLLSLPFYDSYNCVHHPRLSDTATPMRFAFSWS